MRHIFKCVECGADFVKVDASVLCLVCRNKPPKEVEPVVVIEPKPELAPVGKPEPEKKQTKKIKKTAGGE